MLPWLKSKMGSSLHRSTVSKLSSRAGTTTHAAGKEVPRLFGHRKINYNVVEEFESLAEVIELNAFIVAMHP